MSLVLVVSNAKSADTLGAKNVVMLMFRVKSAKRTEVSPLSKLLL